MGYFMRGGSMVRMFKAFLEEEEAEERAEMLQRLARMDERRRQRAIDAKSKIAP